MALPQWRCDGMRCLITGGTKGIGAATVEELCGLGASVFLCARGEVDAPLAAWRQRGFAVAGVRADVSTAAGRAVLVEAVTAHFGDSLDVFFANAGTNIRKPTTSYTPEACRLRWAHCLARFCRSSRYSLFTLAIHARRSSTRYPTPTSRRRSICVSCSSRCSRAPRRGPGAAPQSSSTRRLPASPPSAAEASTRPPRCVCCQHFVFRALHTVRSFSDCFAGCAEPAGKEPGL
jgi:hypothetical protein